MTRPDHIGNAYSSGAMPSARATHASHRANLRCLGLPVGIAIALAGCANDDGNYWSECLNIQTGERVRVIDDSIQWPRVRDKNGFEFNIDREKRPAWRCKREPVQ